MQIEIPEFQLLSHKAALRNVGKVVIDLLDDFQHLIPTFDNIQKSMVWRACYGSLVDDVEADLADMPHGFHVGQFCVRGLVYAAEHSQQWWTARSCPNVIEMTLSCQIICHPTLIRRRGSRYMHFIPYIALQRLGGRWVRGRRFVVQTQALGKANCET